MKTKRWDFTEIQFLKINYSIKGCRYCSKILNRSYNSIKHKANKLNLTRTKWNNKENKILIQNYRKIGSKGCSKLLNRTKSSIRNQAFKLNLTGFLTLEERLIKNQYKDNKSNCWLWSGSIDRTGYGRIDIQGRKYGVHRIAYQIYKSPIPDNYHVCHHCDVRHCFNPDHLFVGTRLDNMKDMVDKGRSTYGEYNPSAKLTEKDIIKIFQEYYINNKTPLEISHIFNVGRTTISAILNGKLWSHITLILCQKYNKNITI